MFFQVMIYKELLPVCIYSPTLFSKLEQCCAVRSIFCLLFRKCPLEHLKLQATIIIVK